jgi:endoglucanase
MNSKARSVLISALGVLLHLSPASATDPLFSQADTLFSRGINLPSAALNDEAVPGVYGTDYIYPSSKYIDYYAQKGFAVIRLPYRWERLQRSLFDDLDRTELARINSFLAAARERNVRVILSPHNFGRYRIDGREVLIGTPRVPLAAFADFCFKVAATFAGNSTIYGLSLMNEPHDSMGMWKETAQVGLAAIRKADPNRLVLAPGDHWSEAASWRQYNEDFVIDDLDSRIMYEAHQYFDADHTGTYKTNYASSGASADRGTEWVHPFVDWLKEHHQKGIITEFGVPNDDPRWLQLAQHLLVYLATEQIPWTYWAGGPRWGNYALSTEPKNDVDAPIMAVLTRDYGVLRPSR